MMKPYQGFAVTLALTVVGLLVVHVVCKLGSSLKHSRFRRRIRGLQYLISGPNIIEEQYMLARGAPFRVCTPSNNHVLITNPELVDEVIHAPLDCLSLHAVAKEMLQPKYTMQGFEWKEQRGVEGTGFVRALRSRLTSHLPHLCSGLEMCIQDSLNRELERSACDGLSHVKIFPATKRLVARANCLVFFGEELSRNDEFAAAALDFPQTLIIMAELLRIIPTILRPMTSVAASLALHRFKSGRTIMKYLEPVVRERLAQREDAKYEGKTHSSKVDCMQWLIETSPKTNPWSPTRMVGEIMAIWFSSVHQLAMATTFAIQDLSLHQDCVQSLRAELQQKCSHMKTTPDVLEGLPLLDSFVKESIRYSNADAITCRRKALQNFVLKDGTTISKDDWVCIPQQALMQDPGRYSNPRTFDGFRFAKANTSLCLGQRTDQVPDPGPSSFTTASIDWPIWGLGSMACPGRFYASLVLKLTLSRIIQDWDSWMVDTTSRRTLTWRSSTVPRESTIVTFRKRDLGDLQVVGSPDRGDLV
ncbi:cytochrome P450 [Xylaria arbuscula]|nr:cytochrome P450 [Xylaria arbuscula]